MLLNKLIGSSNHLKIRKIVNDVESGQLIAKYDPTLNSIVGLGLLKESKTTLTDSIKNAENPNDKSLYEFTKLGKQVIEAYKEKYD